MKRVVFAAVIFILVLASARAIANPPCPKVVDRLEDFAYCMRPFPNGRGQVLVGTAAAGGMDHHTAGLMNSMHNTVSMPQVYPTIPAAISFASNMAVAATATYRHPNWGFYPGFYWWMGVPPYYYMP